MFLCDIDVSYLSVKLASYLFLSVSFSVFLHFSLTSIGISSGKGFKNFKNSS